MKNQVKIILAFILGILVSATGVYAVDTIIIDSENVSYDNSKSNGSYKDVKESIDELYKRTGVLSQEWKDPALNGADPVLTGDLIPIDIEDDGTVHYASLYTKWYDYSAKRWANAVKLVSNPSKSYNTGDKIEEKDIESYFVWIPRYKYKLWNVDQTDGTTDLSTIFDVNTIYKFNSQARLIEVVFGNKDKVKKDSSTKLSSDTSVKNDDYIVHPAFTLNGKELNGIWVGKFETGYNQSSDVTKPITSTTSWNKTGAAKNEQASTRIIVKPNVYSWRSNTVKNFFLSAYNYNRTLDSHMMKNTEWGAVAYLSHSAYGIGTEVRINNNSDNKTGYSAAANTDQSNYGSCEQGNCGTGDNVTKAYNTETGYLASTTGNIYGVYDMSGGTWEVMASYTSSSSDASGFTTEELKKTEYSPYLDVYDANTTETSYSKRKLGDATGEMGPFYDYRPVPGRGTNHYGSWYGAHSYFVHPDKMWFIRSGESQYGSYATQFSFSCYDGNVVSATFRLVLSPST